MKKIKIVGVVGAGTMGAAIAQKFAQEGFTVYLNDREQQYIDKGISGIRTILEEGIERKIFTQEKVENILDNIKGTINQNDLKTCDLIVEAIFEDFNVKCELFKTLDKIVSSDTILATNTSSFSVTEMAASVSHPERFVGLHYFYHAAKNRLVEIIPGEKTSPETTKAVYEFSVLSGKDPIFTADAYGFAVNRFFVPWLNESCKMLDEGIGTIAEIDTICMKTFGIGMGPFALMNATGVPIALHAQKTLEHFGPSYKVAKKLEEQVASKQNWDLTGTGEVTISPEKEKAVNDRILGCTLFVCSQILEEKVCTASDLNRGAKIGLRWRFGPIDLMNKYGEKEVKKLVEGYADLYNEPIPYGIKSDNWKMDFVTLDINESIATITMNRPEDMNALNEEVMGQLDCKFSQADAMPHVKTIILTGSGKAFVAGADIKFFVKNIKSNTINNIVTFTKYGQDVLAKIDKSSKKVVGILNGLTLGGGMELALCCDVLLTVPKTKIAFPETGIGIYPGLGGTQRTALRIGKGLAKYLVLTGQMLDAKTAKEIGLIDEIIQPADIFEYISGAKPTPDRKKQVLSANWQAISDFYTNNNYKKIMSGTYKNSEIDKEAIDKMAKSMSYKAPIAMKFAEELIEAAKGPSSELDKLEAIFTTKDALLGLTSIGKKVEYKGE
ncbi:MAG: 3-hydroxyacyl-CoA dehydrogenase/enoyl-CoA hydratase family protein [Flavobacteriales bacterium]|nr:3-hydroxyacyl-CoA dehydrogenase/enoyl-CoA hydratase family protein [Flavobacteriales bacterium]MCW8911847.1 3-hydroxyacyl-CoA dehydrogenase/enoyl-CoA hydratase family protein [Flavobacteriales bacterium]MCW8936382.1 3-hydroxyacyl-CoA dehydrogenase/enoyl-CoA hydratase family protein [Flavobacteriales bacterium]MCW8939983.1 3-hydroxyacyl-CoA dehydrogenase/enoyl-CoA hydratase family protein [Flavobacteriales bacterium]MCW8990848.1 3-hydroxyacyl-CoA dehydrogenase/enoyl-CoA hydratase family prote